MKLEALFVTVMLFLTCMVIFILGDSILAGIITLIVSLFSREVAMSVFNNTVLVLVAFEVPLTVCACFNYYKSEESKK